MHPPTIHYTQNTLRYNCEANSINETRHLTAADTGQFQAWIDSYRNALTSVNPQQELFTLGQAVYQWLNGSSGLLERMAQGSPWIIEFTVDRRPDAQALEFLEIPWEMMADRHGHFASRRPMFCPVRRIGARK